MAKGYFISNPNFAKMEVKTEVTGIPVIIMVLAQIPARAAPGRIMDAQCLRDARKDRRLQPIR